MLVSAPIAVWVLLLLAFARRRSDLRHALLDAATAWAVLAVLTAEALSAGGWLTRGGLLAAWLGVGAIALVTGTRGTSRAEWERALAATRDARRRLGRADIALLVGTGIVIGLVGTVAVMSPPNTWDAMQYHLPRVVHWIENHRVAFYPTHEARQLHMPPGAELLMLQLHALSGGDRLDNLVQWAAFLGSVVGVTAVARLLGTGIRGQVLAAVVCATIPEGILGASGAKNDWVLSLWLVALAFYALGFAKDPSWWNAAGIGGALGLALLTKGTAYVLAPPLLLALAVCSPRRVKTALARRLPLIVLLALGLVAGHFARNYGLYRSPLGPLTEAPIPEEPSRFLLRYGNETISVSAGVSNAIRNAALHLRSAHRATNAATERWLEGAIRGIGADPSDPRTSFSSFMPFRLPEVERREGLLGNPIHLILAAVALLTLCVTGHRPDRRAVATYSACLVLGFAAFCAVFKWQPSGARLHLPLFVLGSAAVGAVIGGTWPAWAARGLGALLLVAAVPIATGNAARSLAPEGAFSVFGADRSHLYFAEFADAAGPYGATAEFVRKSGCRDIALDLSTEVGAQYEYPMLVLLGAGGTSRVREIGVKNISAVYGPGDAASEPCAVVCVRCVNNERRMAQYRSGGVVPAVFGDIAVFMVGLGRSR